jgi:hypothetical protein
MEFTRTVVLDLRPQLSSFRLPLDAIPSPRDRPAAQLRLRFLPVAAHVLVPYPQPWLFRRHLDAIPAA